LALHALTIIKNFKKIKIPGKSVDDALVSHVKKNRGIVATIDTELKRRVKENGGSILSMANDKIILEPSKI
jgi:rRNA-processing protein FCF1